MRCRLVVRQVLDTTSGLDQIAPFAELKKEKSSNGRGNIGKMAFRLYVIPLADSLPSRITAFLLPNQRASNPMRLAEKVIEEHSDDVYVRFHENFACDRDRIFAYIYAMLPHQADAEDVFQRTSMLLWKKFGQYDGEEGFLAWACTVAHYEVLNFLRTAQRHRLQFDHDLINQIADLRKSGHGESDYRLDALRCCLQGLKGAEREVVEIAYRSEESLREYAESSGAALQTLYNRVSLARRKLLACVKRRVALEGLQS
jgi:RNA polymerase sigma-70 factor, ECF subfamily